MEAITEAIQALVAWFTTGVYDFFVELTAWCIEWYWVIWWKLKVASLKFALDVAAAIMGNIGVSVAIIEAQLEILPYQFQEYIKYFKIPEAINIIIHAVLTKLVLRTI